MKNFIILFFALFFHSAYSQQTIDKLNANQLKLPKESVNKALILDGSGQVKSSATISDTELGYLEGLNDTLVNLLSGKANDGDVVKLTGDQSIVGVKTFTGKLVASSSVNGSIPCPVMSQTQRDAIASPVIGDCVFNSTTVMANIYDGSVWKPIGGGLSLWEPFKIYSANDVIVQLPQYKTYIATMGHTSTGSFDTDLVNGNWLEVSAGGVTPWITGKFYNLNDLMIYDNKIYIATASHTSSGMTPNFANWTQVGGAGGISLWASANFYNLNTIVIESDKIYRCIIAHTSGTFATDLAANRWVEVSSSPATPYSLFNGGTGSSLTAVDGGVVWVDADSFDILSPGTSGQILQTNGAGSPSWVNKSISGKAQNASAVTLEEIQVPNSQITRTDVNKHLVETGNKNILVNPSFEHATFSTGWTNSAGTFAEDLVVEVDGLKAAKLVLSSQTMSLTQSSTLYASQFADGVQGLASVRVKSDVALSVCSIQAGVVSTTNCVSVQANSKWGLYKVPFILGGTSNGISIASSGAVSGTVYIDDAFVGAVDLSATVDSSKMAGESYFAGTTSCTWSRTSTSIGAFTAAAACPGPTIVYSSMGSWQTTDSDLPRQTINNLPAGTYRATFLYNASVTAGAVSSVAITDGTTTCYPSASEDSASASSGQIVSCTFSYPTSGNRVFELYGATASSTLNIINSSTTPPKGTKFQLEYFSSSSIYSSTNADTDWQSCGHTSADFTGLGTVTNINTQCKRDGSDLLMKGSFTVGTVTAVEARLALPIWNGSQLVSAGSSVISGLQLSGDMVYTASNTGVFRHATLIEPSVSYMAFGYQGAANAAFQKATGTIMSLNNQGFAFTARIPIAGWTQSNIIIGQFNGLETCTNSYECTDTFSAKVSAAGVVSDENLDFINGNCSVTNTSTYTCTFRTSTFTTAPNCVVYGGTSADASNAWAFERSPTTSTTLTYRFVRGQDALAVAIPANIICQKQGADYIGKTAKAVASDQNTRSIGVTKSVIQSCKINNNGTATIDNSSSLCGWVSSVSRTSVGNVTINVTSGIFATPPICTLTTHTNGNVIPQRIQSATSSQILAVFITPNTAALADSDFNITCHGVSP